VNQVFVESVLIFNLVVIRHCIHLCSF